MLQGADVSAPREFFTDIGIRGDYYMKTIIMAGGRGTRISKLFPDLPKPLIPIDNVPVLEREIESLRIQGFTDIILTVSYMADRIMDYFGDGSRFGVSIRYYNETVSFGNGGALLKLRNPLGDEDFLLLNADAVFDVDFNRMVECQAARGQSGCTRYHKYGYWEDWHGGVGWQNNESRSGPSDFETLIWYKADVLL